MMQRTRDLIADVILELSARRSRVLLLLVAVALATGSLVASIGIAQTAAEQIDADLAATGTEMLSVTPNLVATASGPGEAAPTAPFPVDAQARASSIDMVKAAGLRVPLGVSDVHRIASGSPQNTSVALDDGGISVAGITSGYLGAVQSPSPMAWMVDGQRFDVAILGASAAQELGIPADLTQYSGYRVNIEGHTFDIADVLAPGAGVVENVVLVPYEKGMGELGGHENEVELLVQTVPGGGAPVAGLVRDAVRPDAPDVLAVSTAVDLERLRTGVSTQLTKFAAAIGGLLLVLTALLIGNSTITSVVSRSSEIGLRRALGASRTRIALLFISEGALTGFLGGIAGAAVGSAAVVAVSAANSWTASMSWVYLVAGPLIGVVVGIVAALYPSLKAAGTEPAVAVRADE